MSALSRVVATIRRRVLVNATAAPDDVAPLLPQPFRPQLVGGRAVVGVCLIRLEHLRPAGLPKLVGFAAESMAHRIAVEWDDEQGTQTGVYILERHSASRLTTLLGGRLVPGAHARAEFDVDDEPTRLGIVVTTTDGAGVRVHARPAAEVASNSVFGSIAEAEEFFVAGCRGYSPRGDGSLDEAELHTGPWGLTALALDDAFSSVFADIPGIEWDSAFVMRDVSCEWRLTTTAARPRLSPDADRVGV